MAAPRVEKRRKLLEHADRVSACRHAQRAAHYAAADGGGERDGRVSVAAYAARDAAEDADRPVVARQHISEFIVGKLVDLFEYFRGKLAPLAVQRDELADLSRKVLAREEHFDREVGEVEAAGRVEARDDAHREILRVYRRRRYSELFHQQVQPRSRLRAYGIYALADERAVQRRRERNAVRYRRERDDVEKLHKLAARHELVLPYPAP